MARQGKVAKRVRKNYGFFGGGDAGDDSGWLYTYGDMMTLLMAFFVFLYAISDPDPKKYKEMMRLMGDALGGGQGSFEAIEEETLESLLKKMEAYIAGENLTDRITFTKDSRGVIMLAGNDSFFEEGDAVLLEDSEIILKHISKILSKSSYKILLEAHTDETPPLLSDKFSSNWQLSSNMASSVAEFLVEKGNISPSRIVTGGYAGFKPRYPVTPENREKNRRFEFVVLREKF